MPRHAIAQKFNSSVSQNQEPIRLYIIKVK